VSVSVTRLEKRGLVAKKRDGMQVNVWLLGTVPAWLTPDPAYVRFPGQNPVLIIDILFLQASGPYVTINLISSGRGLVSSMTLGNALQKLPGFMRTHRSYVVNPDYITRYCGATLRHAGYVVLNRTTKLPVTFSYG
jgi:hypothetical protein